MFNLGEVFKEGIDVLKRNYVLAVPAVIAALVKVVMGSFVVMSPEAVTIVFVIGLAGMVVDYFAHGVALAMAREALEKGETSLKSGSDIALSFLIHFLMTSLVLSVIIIGAGLMLILPGLVAIFLLMFAFPAVVMQGLGPSEAIKKSYGLVRANFNDSLLLFAVLAVLIIAIMVVSLMFSAVLVLGQFIGVVLNGIMGGFSAVVLLRAYIIFDKKVAIPEAQ